MKYKLAVVLFTLTIIAISIYATLRPSYDLGLFVDLGRNYARLRILLALGIFAYVLIPILRLKLAQIIMLVGGGLLLATGVASIFSPLLFGHLSHYTALGDVIMAIEGGTLSLLAGLQLQPKRLHIRLPYFTPLYQLKRFDTVRPGKLMANSQSRTA